MMLATGIALWVELLLVKITESADLIGLLERRLACVEDLLHAYAQGRSPVAAKKELAQFSALGHRDYETPCSVLPFPTLP